MEINRLTTAAGNDQSTSLFDASISLAGSQICKNLDKMYNSCLTREVATVRSGRAKIRITSRISFSRVSNIFEELNFLSSRSDRCA